MKTYKLGFLGTPQFACPILEELIENSLYSVELVITQPDRPAGRGQKLTPPPIKQLALKHQIPVFQPQSLKSLKLTDELVGLDRRRQIQGTKTSIALSEFLNGLPSLDAFITAAYGNIIPTSLLAYASRGIINVHPSLLPRWRGAAPIQAAIFNGDAQTGTCLMEVEEGLDTGGVYAQERLPIRPGDTLKDIHDSLASLSVQLMRSALPAVLSGKLKPEPQDESKATYAHKWNKDDAKISWDDPAEIIVRRVCASDPIPGAHCLLDGDLSVKLFNASKLSHTVDRLPGKIVAIYKNSIVVAAGANSAVEFGEIQLAGKRRMTMSELLRGHPLSLDSEFS